MHPYSLCLWEGSRSFGHITMARFLLVCVPVCCFIALTQAIVEPDALPPAGYHDGYLPHQPPTMTPAPHHHHSHHPHGAHHHPPTQAPAHPPSHVAPALPPAHHHHHHHHPAHAPVHAPSHQPVHPPPAHAYPPRHAPVVHPPAKPPTHAAAKPPVYPLPRRFIAVQGVVYCKSCKYAGFDNLLGATPVVGAIVKLQCNNTKSTIVVTAKTDKHGYFFIEAPKTVTSYAFHRCKAFLVSSPLATCKKPSNQHGELLGAMLRPEKPFMYKGLPFVLYSVGPFAFEPSCPR